jgi:hypothetical protein
MWYLDGQLMNQYTDKENWKWNKPPAGGHVMRLKVDDDKGASDTASRKIKITGDTEPDGDDDSGFVITIPKCFIATAAYGSPTARELDTLRAFRDKALLRSELGTALVEFYYQTSPPIASFIAGHEAIRTVVREAILDPIVFVVKHTESCWDKNTGE